MRQQRRTGIVVSIGGEFGFALLTILLRDQLVAPDVVQPLLAAIVLSMVASPLIIRHNKQIARWLLRESGPAPTALARELASTHAVAQREHVLLCGFGRVGRDTLRAYWRSWASNISLSTTMPHGCARRVRRAIQSYTATPARKRCSKSVGLDRASVVVISFAEFGNDGRCEFWSAGYAGRA